MSGGTNLPQETKRSIYYTKRQRSRLYKKYPQFLVQVLPKAVLGLGYLPSFTWKNGIKNPVTVVVTGFLAPISKSVRIVGCGGGICCPSENNGEIWVWACGVKDTYSEKIN